MDDYEIKEAFKNHTDGDVLQENTLKCSMYRQCKGCRYPAHGFVCWNRDGTCLRTEIQGDIGHENTYSIEQ